MEFGTQSESGNCECSEKRFSTVKRKWLVHIQVENGHFFHDKMPGHPTISLVRGIGKQGYHGLKTTVSVSYFKPHLLLAYDLRNFQNHDA